MNDLDIAIIGMATLVPGAADVDTFWRNLVDGKCALQRFSDAELQQAGSSAADLQRPDYVRVGARLAEIDCFDNEFFGISNREAGLIDPQHRLLLEFGWKAFEDAGYDIRRYPGLVGVYAGLGMNTYLTQQLLGSPEVDLGRDGQAIVLGNAPDYAATRLSYLFNLRGPSMTIQTACSSSLVAVHEACQGLLGFHADMALAGGCSVTLPHPRGYIAHPDSILSPDGTVRAFDAAAAGTVFTGGLALVVLKRRADAERDGDNIRAIIKGSAINNDGSDKVGYAAPSVRGQARVIEDALTIAGVAAEAIDYVETHGTATALGDVVEIRALTEVYRSFTAATQFCAIGSVKTNVGHTDVAAGAVGLIKTALSLQHRVLPASLGYQAPNPRLDLAASPFVVNSRSRDWDSRHERRHAAVSSFGIGGTNAHLILAEADRPAPAPHRRELYGLTLSARTFESLRRLVAATRAALAGDVTVDWADICYTSNVGRQAFRHRHLVLAEDVASLRDNLQRMPLSEQPARDRRLSVAVDADGARALAADAPEQFATTASDPAQATVRLVELLQQAGIDAEPALPPAADAAAPASAETCRLIVSGDAVWLQQDDGAELLMARAHRLARLLPIIAGEAWRLGVAVDWERFYAGERRRRVSFPTTQFARRRHWPARHADDSGPAGEAAGARNAELSQWFYRPIWQETATPIGVGPALDGDCVLVISQAAPSPALRQALARARLIEVGIGVSFAQLAPDRYVVAPDDERSYAALARALAEAGALPRYLLHALLVDDAPWSGDSGGFEQTLASGLNSLVLLLRQLAARLGDDQPLSVMVAVSDLADLSAESRPNPDKAAVLGAVRTFPSEYPAIDGRVVDIPAADFCGDASALQAMLAEFCGPVTPDNQIVAIRGRRRWYQRFVRLSVPAACASPVSADGAYVILGGLGEFGLSLSRYLAGRARCNLVLLGSSAFVPRSQWDDWIARHGDDHAFSRKIATLRAIEAGCARLRVVQCDVAERDQLHRALDAARAEFGILNAVIHSAGVVENGMVAHKDVSRFAEIFRAKVQGSYHLLDYAAAHPGAKIILCSSMNALVGGLGQIDNTAANAVVDAAATTGLARRAGDVCSINWGAINTARLADPVALPQFADLSREHKKNHMSEDEIHQVYDRILSWSFGPRLVVSTIDFDVVLKRWGEVGRVTELARLRQVATAVAQPARPGASAYRSELHRFVAESWCGLLGLEALAWDDDLFERGAHSLSSVQFSQMLKDALGLRLHAMALYEFRTLGALVDYLQSLRDQQQAKLQLQEGRQPWPAI